MGPFDIILADPPWDYAGQTQHGGKGNPDSGGAIKHYPTMTLDQMIKEIHPIDWAKPDCLLFMWSTWPHLDQAIKLGTAWGFRYVHTPFIWHKQKTNPGYYTLTQTEPVLCFKLGRIPQPRGTRNERQVVEWPRQQHSQKPPEVQERIERMWPTQAKLEMFARTTRPGWHAWGNQVGILNS